MLSDRRDSGRRFRGALWLAGLGFVVSASSACTAVAGGGVVAVLVGISALTSHCYDYLDVTVFNPQGRKTCAATVTAHRLDSSESFELESCYYTPLSDGRWTLRATLPGSPDVETRVDVSHEDDCTRHVQSVELTLDAPGSKPNAPTAPTAAAISAPTASAAPPAGSAAPPAVVAPSSSSLPAPSAPTAPSATAPSAAGGAPSTVAPPAGGASSVGVFPTQSVSSP